jgi:hypothetical protein
MMNDATKLNIFQRMLKVQQAVEYVKKDVSIQGAGKGVARDAVVAAVRQHLIANGVYVYTSQTSGDYRNTPRTNKEDNKLTIYAGWYTTRFVNVDDPKDFIEVSHAAEGQDYGDKAFGKSSTYAEKLNLVKGLFLETGIDDESRNPGEVVTDDTPPETRPETGKAPIKTPKSKEPEAAPEDNTPASAGMLKMIRAEAVAKGLAVNVEASVKKAGYTMDAMPKTFAKKLLAKLEKSAMREPGQEG